jgi:hypothetical protein
MPGFFFHFLQFDHCGNLAMQEMVQIQPVSTGFSVREILRSGMDARECHALRSRILRRVKHWRTTFGVAKQHCWTRTFRHDRFAKQGTGTIRYRGRNRYSGRIQIGEKPGFGIHIGVATATPA